MTNAQMASRHRIHSDDLSELIKEFDLGDVINWRHLTDGLMNVNWQLDTPRGTFALKRVTDVPLDRLRRNLAVLPTLAEAGIPVIVPIVGSSGGVEFGGSGYCLFPWAPGAHVRGVDLPLAQVRRLGAVLAKLHLALGHAAETGALSAVPIGLTANVVTPERASEKADRLATAARAHSTGDAFHGAALDALAKRRVLLAKYAALRPEGDVPAGPYGWTHGDFQPLH